MPHVGNEGQDKISSEIELLEERQDWINPDYTRKTEKTVSKAKRKSREILGKIMGFLRG